MRGNEQPSMDQLQQEAARRVQEMQARARRAAGLDGKKPPEPGKPPAPREKEEKAAAPEAPPGPPAPSRPPEPPKPAPAVWDALLQDRERTMILMLVLILSAEKADAGLILALMYLAQ